MTMEEKTKTRLIAARFNSWFDRFQFTMRRFCPAAGRQKQRRVVATTWRGKLLRINMYIAWIYLIIVCIIYIYCMNACTRARDITKFWKVTHTGRRIAKSREKKIVFILPTVVRFDFAQNVSHLDIIRDIPYVRCIVPYAFTWKCSLHSWTLNIFTKFMWGKQIDISFVENNSSHRTITSRILWRLFKIVIYLNYQVGIFC